MCVCVCVCARARARAACVRVRARAHGDGDGEGGVGWKVEFCLVTCYLFASFTSPVKTTNAIFLYDGFVRVYVCMYVCVHARV